MEFLLCLLGTLLQHIAVLIRMLIHKEIQDSLQEFSEKIDHVNFKIEVLNDKIDTVEARLNDKIEAVQRNLAGKIDAVADDLSAHRADTEAHHGLYLVKEE